MNQNSSDRNIVVCPVCGLTLPAQLKKCPQDGVLLKGVGAPDPLIGTVLAGRYEIVSLIGHGGMSVVYKARNRAIGSIVAVKTLKHDLISDEELFARFCQEAKAVQMLTHPNILAVHEFGVTLTGQPFIVMDYLDGLTLSDIIEVEGRVPVKRALKIFIQVCDALGHAHAHNIVHRDVKPGNIMLLQTVNATDMVKVFDFGFAKLLPTRGKQTQQLTQSGDVLGTPLYMSPEQSRGKQLDSRSDIYSLGCVLYEALTGKPPLIGSNPMATMEKQISQIPESLDEARPDLYIPDQLAKVLFKTLEKDVSKRYQSMAELKRDLEAMQFGMTGQATIPPGKMPALTKLRESQPYDGEPDKPLFRNIAIGAAIIMTVTIGIILMSPKQHPDTAPVTNNVPPTQPTLPSLPTFSGEPPVVFAKYRQAALQARDRHSYTESEDLLAVALKQAQNTDDVDDRMSTIYVDLAKVYIPQDKLSDAEKAADRALALREKLGQINSRAAADVFAVFADIALARENWRSALTYLQKALAIQERELGPLHQDVATTLNKLGNASQGLNAYSRAEAYYKQALAIQQNALGPSKPAVAQTLTDYARLLKKLDREQQATQLELQARTIRETADQ